MISILLKLKLLAKILAENKLFLDKMRKIIECLDYKNYELRGFELFNNYTQILHV